jgi:hypothetical protein
MLMWVIASRKVYGQDASNARTDGIAIGLPSVRVIVSLGAVPTER